MNRETSRIVLHSLDLDLVEVSLLSDANPRPQPATSIEFDTSPTQQRAAFTFAKPAPAHSEAVLAVAYKADITDFRAGYYKSLGGADNKAVYALTQFQVGASPSRRRIA